MLDESRGREAGQAGFEDFLADTRVRKLEERDDNKEA